MNTEMVLFLIQDFLLFTGFVIFILLALRNNLRWSLQTTLILCVCYMVFSWTTKTVVDSEMIEALLFDVVFWGLFFSLFKEYPLRSITFWVLFRNLINLCSNLLIALVYGGLSLFKGHLSWLVLDQAGLGFRIAMFILFVPAFLIAYKTALYFKDPVMTATGKLMWALFLLFPVRNILFTFVSDICCADFFAYRNDPEGIRFFLDFIEIVIFIIGLTVLLFIKIHNSRKSYHHLQTDAAVDAAAYREEVADLKSALHQIRHDTSNWQGDPSESGEVLKKGSAHEHSDH